MRIVALVWTLALAALASCSSSVDPNRAGGGSPSKLPVECTGAGITPFTTAECGRAIKTVCRGHQTEQECAAEEPFEFDGGGYQFHCGWAKVVTFSDVANCAVQSVAGRCEAGITQEIGCSDPCDGGEPALYDAMMAIPSALELVAMPCAPDGGILDGPVGEWSLVSSGVVVVQSCGGDLPPPPKPLCDCAATACQAH